LRNSFSKEDVNLFNKTLFETQKSLLFHYMNNRRIFYDIRTSVRDYFFEDLLGLVPKPAAKIPPLGKTIGLAFGTSNGLGPVLSFGLLFELIGV
jgi:hypothetical protein